MHHLPQDKINSLLQTSLSHMMPRHACQDRRHEASERPVLSPKGAHVFRAVADLHFLSWGGKEVAENFLRMTLLYTPPCTLACEIRHVLQLCQGSRSEPTFLSQFLTFNCIQQLYVMCQKINVKYTLLWHILSFLRAHHLVSFLLPPLCSFLAPHITTYLLLHLTFSHLLPVTLTLQAHIVRFFQLRYVLTLNVALFSVKCQLVVFLALTLGIVACFIALRILFSPTFISMQELCIQFQTNHPEDVTTTSCSDMVWSIFKRLILILKPYGVFTKSFSLSPLGAVCTLYLEPDGCCVRKKKNIIHLNNLFVCLCLYFVKTVNKHFNLKN